jgi:hypothetical protein
VGWPEKQGLASGPETSLELDRERRRLATFQQAIRQAVTR